MIAWLTIAACHREDPAPDTLTVSTPPIARCGDGVLAEGEACDDGNALGGDGCLPDCSAEPDPLEAEPNDAWDAANAWTAAVHAALPEGDTDCFSFEVPDCAAVTVRLDCPSDGLVALHDPYGIVIASGSGGPGVCPSLDPAIAPGARFLDAGTYTACVSSLTGATIPAYTLDVSVDAGGAFPLPAGEDPDADGTPSRCDDDDDGDGALDAADTCPTVSNGPLTPPLAVTGEGWVGHWLVLAPIVGAPTAGECRPSDDELPGGDAALAPELGEAAAGLVWTAALDEGAVFDFLPSFGFATPSREVYAHAYVFSPTARDVTLAVGADDGVRAWVEGAELLDIGSCQGVNLDQFQAATPLQAGWNRLTLKVRDWGGGWGMAVRFLDGGAPVTDLELSLSADPSWAPDQTDSDGDGLGDVCDPTPLG